METNKTPKSVLLILVLKIVIYEISGIIPLDDSEVES